MSCILLTSFAEEVSSDTEGNGLTSLYLIHIQNSCNLSGLMYGKVLPGPQVKAFAKF